MKILIYILYALTPALLNFLGRKKFIFSWLADAAVVLAVWLPIELGLLPNLGFDASLLQLLIAVVNLSLIFWRLKIGFSFKFKQTDIVRVLLTLPLFLAVVIGLGLVSGFLKIGLAGFTPKDFLRLVLVEYFIIAIPEELLFRGVMQNLFEKYLGNNTLAWLSASVIFGISHINNATLNDSVPNYKYVVLATLAGLYYGYIWQKSRLITVSALAHTTVNCVWLIFLNAGQALPF
jgi:membrane protease YdiL (CAAX protease family)